ncbi:hypothetical protein HOK00_01395 [bacterium]|nr:hypothetical protein [bacterium]
MNQVITGTQVQSSVITEGAQSIGLTAQTGIIFAFLTSFVTYSTYVVIHSLTPEVFGSNEISTL